MSKLTRPQSKILGWIRKDPKTHRIFQEKDSRLAYWGNITTDKDGKCHSCGGIIKYKTWQALLNKKVIKEDPTVEDKLLKYWTLA